MTRAVIKLEKEIGHIMPILEEVIEGCAYNPHARVAAFRYKNWGVTVNDRTITVIGADNVTVAKEVISFLLQALENADVKNGEKMKGY